ncbi:ankyrin repeat domain-containing protein [Wolbachia endosymbiont of Pentidionis agamae]|uniref:ankyrin repeat domain-containing protein n=1 Tax=Wolbachia endosymbiont of Pentidionis agamae TaxID=3110435 RepID=UPI0038CD864D
MLKAIQDNNLTEVKRLVGKVDINAIDEGDYTSLHLAAQNWHIEIVVLLINFRANVNARDNSGYTTLF